ncbi:recombination regulator RecX [Ramlibacter algicola]|uniref:Regulatory protein RecX n=1 Tax=Ramlibacter algicola TaxID=2795217 RepID=A0A934PVM2_9BURK|nr:recombination regulator RecX [Ramlibacter algicola]MBK0391294.1 recombination regulator RecX [Ramlibacter algicola]
MPVVQLSLKGRALRLLGNREHTRTELERKLARYAEQPDELAKVLDDLQAKGFISEQRVVESVLHRRAARLGAGRIRQELQAKGVDGELVAHAMQQLRATEIARARDVWQRRFGEPPRDTAERGKQARFLAARGFTGDVIQRVLAGGFDEDGG